MRVERCTKEAAARWVGQWHYLGKVGGGQVGYFGVRDDAGQPVAMVLVGMPTNPHGVAKKYDLTEWKGNVEITRVVVRPDLQEADAAARAAGGDPANWASQSLAAVSKHLGDEGYEWLFSYADTGQGHHGGIYQAIGATYVGFSAARPGFLEDGVPLHPRSCVARYGTQAWKHPAGDPAGCPGLTCRPDCVGRIAAEAGKHLVKVDGMLSAKHCYIIVCAKSKKTRRAIRHALERHVLPYPKHGEPLAVASRENSRPSRSDSPGRSRSTAPRTVAERVATGIRSIARQPAATTDAPPAAVGSPPVAAAVIQRAREGTDNMDIDLATRRPVVAIELVGGKLVAIIDDPDLDDCKQLRATFGDRLVIGPSLSAAAKVWAAS